MTQRVHSAESAQEIYAAVPVVLPLLLEKSRVALHPRRKGWLGTFSAPLRIPLKGPYGSGKSQWGLDNIMALQIIFQNTAAISAIFPEFVTVSSGKVLKMG